MVLTKNKNNCKKASQEIHRGRGMVGVRIQWYN